MVEVVGAEMVSYKAKRSKMGLTCTNVGTERNVGLIVRKPIFGISNKVRAHPAIGHCSHLILKM